VSDKTEEPTPRRLRKAREEGDSGASSQFAQSIAFLVAVALVPAAARALAAHAADDLRSAIAAAGAGAARFDPLSPATTVVALSFPVLVAAGIAGGVALAVQTGGVVATRRLTPRLDRLDPAAGLRAIVSPSRLFAVARALVAGAIVAWLAWRGLRDHVVDLARSSGRLRWAVVVLSDAAAALGRRAALAGVVLGAVDLLVTRATWRRRLRMSKDEVRREHKDTEGDPQIKAARERAYHELMAQAAIANVRTASVVVVNPTHLACALRYDDKEGDEAPVVVASGQGELAARIVQAAREYGVPVVQDVPLARALVELQVGDAIPEALYEAVAEILREIWQESPQPPP
jgi:type III secretion protein U